MPGPMPPDLYLREITSLRYSFEEIVKTRRVFDTFLRTAAITLNNGGQESSFAICGDDTEYELTTPSAGERDSVYLPRQVGSGMTVGDQVGHGLHLPSYLIPIMRCHFHPPDNFAVPSLADLTGAAPNRFNLNSGDQAVIPVQVVGHYDPPTNTKHLFFWQYQGHDAAIGTNNAADIASSAYHQMRRLTRNLDPVENAEALDSIDNFSAVAFQFKGWKRYNQRVQRDLADKFTLLQDVHDTTPDLEEMDTLDPNQERLAELDDLLDQLETENARDSRFRRPRERGYQIINPEDYWGELE